MNQMGAWFRTYRDYFLPAGLGVFNIALAVVWFAFLMPQIDSFAIDMRRLKTVNDGLRAQIDVISTALETIDENREKYNTLTDNGFIDPQDRLGVTKLMDRLREIHGLTSIIYEISPQTMDDDRTARKTGFHVVSSKVVIKMRGLFDADILEFTQAIFDEFPGQVRPTIFSLSKLGVPNEESLGLLREGKLFDFIGGELTFEWNTLDPLPKKNSG